MKNLKAIIVATLFIFGAQALRAQDNVDPGGGIRSGSAQGDPCIEGASPWHMGGDVIVPPAGYNPANPVTPTTPVPRFDIGTCNDYPFILKANDWHSVWILPGGNVGVNNSMPQEKLHVNGTSRVDGKMLVNGKHCVNCSGATAAALEVVSGNVNDQSSLMIYGNAQGKIESSSHFNFLQAFNHDFGISEHGFSGPASRLLVRQGMVGINNSNPSAALDIRDKSNSGSLKIHGNTFGDIEASNQMHLKFAPGSHFAIGETTSPNTFTERISVNFQGNVGIDEAGPQQKFHVNGNTLITGNLAVGINPAQEKFHLANGNMLVDGNARINGVAGINCNASQGSEFDILDASMANMRLLTIANNDARLTMANLNYGLDIGITGNGAGYMRINQLDFFNWKTNNTTPQVWLGGQPDANSPHFNTFSFAVKGLMVAQEVVVTQSNWSDFVFKPEFSLMPLDELEQYYKSEHHLPGVPSEREILETGNDLAQTDAILLQKIEELTLYIVELKKEINALKK